MTTPSGPRAASRRHLVEAAGDARPGHARRRRGRRRPAPAARGREANSPGHARGPRLRSSCTTCASRSAARARCSASCAGVFAPEPLRGFATSSRSSGVTGPTRDLDVQLLEWRRARRRRCPRTCAGARAAARAARGPPRARAARRWSAALRSRRARGAARDWRAFVDGLVGAPEDDRPDAARPVVEVAGERIGKVYRRMVKTGARSTTTARRGAARPAQEGQGAALPARVLRVAVSERGRQADGHDAEGPAGRARPLPGPRGAGRAPALARRRGRRRSSGAARR